MGDTSGYWKTGWSLAHRRTTFTHWENQDAFSYKIYNNLPGRAVRLKFSNWYGRENRGIKRVRLTMGERAFTLKKDGRESFCVTNAEDVYSDVLEFPVRPGPMRMTVEFTDSRRPESGNTFDDGAVFIVQSIEVLCKSPDLPVVAVLGDSITHRMKWVRPLTARLYAEHPGEIALFESSITTSRLLNDSPRLADQTVGLRGMTRMRHDILGTAGITRVFFQLGLNDLRLPEEPGETSLCMESFQDAVSEIISAGHDAGLAVIGMTITPRTYDAYYTPEKNELRKRMNRWILDEADFDGCVDIAGLLANDTDTALREEYDSGDGVHISDCAGERIAGAVCDDLLFGESRPEE